MADSRLRPPLRRSPFLSAGAERSPYARPPVRSIIFELPNSFGDPAPPETSAANATANATNPDLVAPETPGNNILIVIVLDIILCSIRFGWDVRRCNAFLMCF